VHSLATDVNFQPQIGQLRKTYPVFRIDAARAICGSDAVRLEFQFTCGTATFEPAVELTGLRPDEAVLAHSPTAQRLIRALAIVEAFSYWKAFCSPVIEVALPPYDQAELAWWQAFWPKAMGEFFYRNNINFTEPGFLQIAAPPGPAALASTAAESSQQAPPRGDSVPPLIMFSGGKDSLALTFAARETSTSPTDFFLYNPTSRQRSLAESLTAGGRILEVHRDILPELLALNAANHPNGHTPYSAYLAVAALLAGHLRGSELVLAGNSRSDDEKPRIRVRPEHLPQPMAARRAYLQQPTATPLRTSDNPVTLRSYRRVPEHLKLQPHQRERLVPDLRQMRLGVPRHIRPVRARPGHPENRRRHVRQPRAHRTL
jgi:hypothetical protein